MGRGQLRRAAAGGRGAEAASSSDGVDSEEETEGSTGGNGSKVSVRDSQREGTSSEAARGGRPRLWGEPGSSPSRSSLPRRISFSSEGWEGWDSSGGAPPRGARGGGPWDVSESFTPLSEYGG